MTAALLPLGNDRIDAPGLHLLRMAPSANRRHREHAGVLEGLDDALARRLCEAGDLDLLANEKVDALHDVGLIGTHVDAERLVGPAFDLRNRLLQLAKRHGRGGQNTETTGPAGGRGEARTGHPTHPGLNDWVFDTEHVADARVES